jgi:hypothetical protein
MDEMEFFSLAPELTQFTAGLGQKAGQLPPDWKCYTEAEVELIISRLSLDIRAKLASRLAVANSEK